MRVVLTGAAGQLGQALQAAFADHDLVPLTRADLDVAQAGAAERLEGLKPELILHAAAFTDVDGCEEQPDRAYRINQGGARQAALAAARSGAGLVYFSTDYVFPGDRPESYHEGDAPRPVNAYGRSKLAGERAVAAATPHHLIVRTAWLYGDGQGNFVGRMLALGRAGRPFPVVDNEVGSPTYTRDLAPAIRRLVERWTAGTYHLVNEGRASRFELARSILELAGLDTDLVQPTGRYPRPAARPPCAVLDNTAARALGVTLRPWPEALAARLQRRG